MKRSSMLIVVLLLTVQSVFAESAAVVDAKQKVAAGQYKEALQSIAKSLGTSSAASDPEERDQLFMLKGEAMLQTGVPNAPGAFDSAASIAKDAKDVAPARATALLIRASLQGKYRPKVAGAELINILTPDGRKQGLAALREDLKKSVAPEFEKAMAGDTLTPMFEVLPKLIDLGYLEFSATGAATESRGELQKMGTRARELIDRELHRLKSRTDVRQSVMHSTFDGTTRGLNSDERNDVRNDVTYLKMIEKTCRDARRKAIELGFDGKAWEPLASDAADLAERNQAILEFNP